MKPRADFYTTKAGYTQSWCRKCSQASKDEWRRANSAEYNARRALKFDRDRSCAVCGGQYRAIARRQSRCGPCHDANRKVPVTLTCQTCSLPLTTTRRNGKYHLECRPLIVTAAAARSAKADARRQAAVDREMAAAVREAERIAARTRLCDRCGGAYLSNAGGRQRFCSDDCRHAHHADAGRFHPKPTTCGECGSEFIPAMSTQVYCGPRCSKRHDKRRRSYLKRGASSAESVSRSRVYARDGYTCQLCRRPVRMDKSVPHPKAPTLDHRIPLAAGGEHSYANVQLAHFLCNSTKSAGDAQLVLGLMGW